MKFLPIRWYLESPIDFEHKQYVLFDYLQTVDYQFLRKSLSPHLLYMEKIVNELNSFEENYKEIKKNFNKNRYIYFNDNSKLEGENFSLIVEISEIVQFSKPQIKTRIDSGYKILEKNKQILY